MNKKEMTNALKRENYARQAGWLKKYRPDEYDILAAAEPKNRLRLNRSSEWVQDNGPIGAVDCLILKPDYEPEPEVRKNRRLARIIAEHLYTQTGAGSGGANVLVERVVLMKKRAHSHEELLGGLCFASAKTVIEKLLDDAEE